jgi:hypothetical protein
MRHEFKFGVLGPMGTDFSGHYFLIVSPQAERYDGIVVNSFRLKKVEDEESISDYDSEIEMTQEFIDCVSLQEYIDSNNIEMRPKSDVRYESHKIRIIPTLTQAVLSLLADLSSEARARLLENETPEELVEYCKEKYDEEFDLHVEDLGVAGAHEIAWQEALAILENEQQS